MSFPFSAPSKSNRQTHLKHSPSLTLELGTSRLRTTRSSNHESSPFHTNADTGIDMDGELKVGYASGDVRSLSTIPDTDAESLPRRSGSMNSASSPLLQTFEDLLHSKPLSRTPSFTQWLEQQRIQREALRKKRMRQAGGTVDCGIMAVLLTIMTICLLVILFVYFHVR